MEADMTGDHEMRSEATAPGTGRATRTFARTLAIMFLAAAGAALAISASATATTEEVEPNNALANATALPLNDDGQGTTNNTDVDYWVIGPIGPGTLAVYLQQGSACTQPRLLFENGTLGQPSPLYNVFAGYGYLLLLDSNQSIFVEMCTSTNPGYYYLSASFSPPSSRAEGTDESEPNDDPAHADDYPQGRHTANGRLDSARDAVDVWSFTAPIGGYLFMRTDAEGAYPTPYDEQGGRLEFVDGLGSGGWYGSYLVNASQRIFVVVSFSEYSYSSAFQYNLTLQAVVELSEGSEGAGEVEPNNDAGTATPLVANGTYNGTIIEVVDDVDYFVVDAKRGEFIRIAVGCDSLAVWMGCSFGVGAPDHTDNWGSPYIAQPGEFTELRLFIDTARLIVFGVSSSYGDEDYWITLERSQSSAYDDGVAYLSELTGNPSTPVWLSPHWDSYQSDLTISLEPYRAVGLETCAYLRVSNPVSAIMVGATERLSTPSGGRWVAVGVSQPLYFRPVPYSSGVEACFQTMVYEPNSDLRNFTYSSQWMAPADGRPASVLGAISARGVLDAPALLALWAVTSAINTSGATHRWNASNETITQARGILNASGVGYCTTGLANISCTGFVAPPEPEEPGQPNNPQQPGTNHTVGQDSGATVAVAFAAASAGAGAAAFFAVSHLMKRRGRPPAGEPPPPAAPEPSSQPPSPPP